MLHICGADERWLCTIPIIEPIPTRDFAPATKSFFRLLAVDIDFGCTPFSIAHLGTRPHVKWSREQ